MSKNTRLTLIIYCLTAITIPLQFIFKAYLTQHVSLVDAGIFFGLFGLVSLVGIYSDHGWRELLLHYIPKLLTYKNNDKLRGMISITLGTQIIVGGIVSCLFVLLARFVFGYVCHTSCGYSFGDLRYIIYWFAFFQFVVGLSGSLESIVLGLGQSHLAKMCEIIKLGGYSAVILTLSYLGILDLNHLLQIIVFVPVLAIVFLAIYLGLYHKELFIGTKDYSVWIDLKKPLMNAFAIAHAIGLYSLVDVVLVQSLSGGGDAALYTNAILMTNGYIFVIASIAPFIGSKISFFHHEIDREEMGLFLSKVCNLLLIISLIGWGSMMSILRIASNLIHGKLAIDVFSPAFILGVGSIFGALLQFLMLILSGLGMYPQKNKAMWLGVFVLVVGSFVLSLFASGLYAVAISMSIAQCVMALCIGYQIIRSYQNFTLYMPDIVVFGLLGLGGIGCGILNYFYFTANIAFGLLIVLGYLLIIGLTIILRYGGLKERYGDLFVTQTSGN